MSNASAFSYLFNFKERQINDFLSKNAEKKKAKTLFWPTILECLKWNMHQRAPLCIAQLENGTKIPKVKFTSTWSYIIHGQKQGWELLSFFFFFFLSSTYIREPTRVSGIATRNFTSMWLNVDGHKLAIWDEIRSFYWHTPDVQHHLNIYYSHDTSMAQNKSWVWKQKVFQCTRVIVVLDWKQFRHKHTNELQPCQFSPNDVTS